MEMKLQRNESLFYSATRFSGGKQVTQSFFMVFLHRADEKVSNMWAYTTDRMVRGHNGSCTAAATRSPHIVYVLEARSANYTVLVAHAS